VLEGEGESNGFNSVWNCLQLDIAETVYDQYCSIFYRSKKMFDLILLSVANSSKWRLYATRTEQGIRVIEEKFDVVGLVASMNLGEKLSRCLFRDGRIAAQMEFFVDIRLSSAVQPKPLIGTANHRFVSRELIPSPSKSAGGRLYELSREQQCGSGLSQYFRNGYLPIILIYNPSISNPYSNRPPRCPVPMDRLAK
jgi:hypothetical protein